MTDLEELVCKKKWLRIIPYANCENRFGVFGNFFVTIYFILVTLEEFGVSMKAKGSKRSIES